MDQPNPNKRQRRWIDMVTDYECKFFIIQGRLMWSPMLWSARRLILPLADYVWVWSSFQRYWIWSGKLKPRESGERIIIFVTDSRGWPRDLMLCGLLLISWKRMPIFLPFTRALWPRNWPTYMCARSLLATMYRFPSYSNMMCASLLSFGRVIMRSWVWDCTSALLITLKLMVKVSELFKNSRIC